MNGVHDTKNSVLRNTLRRLLKPLIRILLRYGYSYKEFNNLARELFIDVSYEDFTLEGRKMSASRVAVLTGLDRKEIVKIMSNRADDDQPVRRPINRASRVIGGWLQDNDYQSTSGAPLAIPVKGDGISFQSLVSKYGGDITFGPILDELLRIKAVEYDEDKHVKLLAEGYLPVSDEMEILKIMGDSVNDMLTTIDYNLSSPKHARYQREVIYLNLSQGSINEFKLVSHDKSQKLLLEMNEWLANKLELDTRLEITQPTSRVGLGIYYIEDEPPKPNGDEKSRIEKKSIEKKS